MEIWPRPKESEIFLENEASHAINKINRSNLSGLENGELIVCLSRISGVNFLLQYQAWGYITATRNPKYLALYIRSPAAKIEYFAEIDRILDANSMDSPIKNPEKYSTYDEQKVLIILKKGTLRKINDTIPLSIKQPPRSYWYTDLSSFIRAKSLDDLL